MIRVDQRCLTSGCERQRIPTSSTGIVHAHCHDCEVRILHEAYRARKEGSNR